MNDKNKLAARIHSRFTTHHSRWESLAKAPLLLSLCLMVGASELIAQNKAFTNSIGMEFVRIEPGNMVVGKFQPPYPASEDTVKGQPRPMIMWMGEGRPYNAEEFKLAKALALRDATSGFEVVLSSPYFIGKFEVTQHQWEEVMNSNPSTFRDDPSRPVETVTWEDVQEFLRRLNQREEGKNYRLPTEFEWEYAARAGAEGDIAWSEIQRVAQLGTDATQPVGQKEPNGWGLYDMLGNVWEWVADYYNEKIFADPEGPYSGKTHVLKGASFVGDVKNATWLTHAGGPGNGWDVGFRIVLEIPEEQK